jgi:hypothetical protein
MRPSRVSVPFLIAVLAGPPHLARADGPPADALKIEWREVVWGGRHGELLHAQQPFQGGKLLQGEELFLALGRPDLAATFKQHESQRTTIGGLGGVLVCSGLVTMAIGASEQKDGGSSTPTIAGLVITLVGAYLALSASDVPNVVTNDDLHHLVDVHNQSLPSRP